MTTSWLRPNLYVVQNGKLVARPTTPEQKKNYRYIPFEPFNNPAPEDYFRETISRLQKENTYLKNDIASRLHQEERKNIHVVPVNSSQQIQQYQNQVIGLKQQLIKRQHELEQKNRLLIHKDKQILELGNENTRLHLRIGNVMKQVESLNFVMHKKDQQLLNKKQKIQEYCRVLEKLTNREKQQQRTMASQNYLTTPKIQEKNEQDDEFYSVECNSLNDFSIDRRYMTPQIQAYRNENVQNLYRSQKQSNLSQKSFYSINNSRENSVNNEEIRESDANKEMNNWSSWANLVNNKNSFSLNILENEIDPVAGSFSNILPSRK